MAGFLFRLETADGEPAEPPTLSAAVPDWPIGSRIYLGRRTFARGGQAGARNARSFGCRRTRSAGRRG
jgi:hypothetical protein